MSVCLEVTTAIKALREGKCVQASVAKGLPFYYKMFAYGLILLMEQVTSCAAREVERMDEEGFLTRGELSKFIIYD